MRRETELQILVRIALVVLPLPLLMTVVNGSTEGAVMTGVLVAGYWLPWIVAKCRNNSQSLSIFWLNTFLGWTFIGWVVSLVWACAANQASATASLPPAATWQ
jgi:hypothetical protein